MYICAPQSEIDLFSYDRCITWYTRHCIYAVIVETIRARVDRYLSVETRLSALVWTSGHGWWSVSMCHIVVYIATGAVDLEFDNCCG